LKAVIRKGEGEMGYEIVKTIKVENGRVFVNGACNNVYPKDYHYSESYYLTGAMERGGQEELDYEIMRAYEEGNFQPGNQNKYSRAVCILRHMPEYEKYDWRQTGAAYEEAKKLRETKEFRELLLLALKTGMPKDKYIVTKPYRDKTVYLYKITTRAAKWIEDKTKAKMFFWEKDAENLKSCFYGAENWQIEKVS
jgi:hypothetical protein